MLSDLVKGRTAQDVAEMPREELLDELGIPLTPCVSSARSSDSAC